MKNNRKILLVEDDINISSLLKDLLTSENFEVTHVDDGLIALNVLNTSSFDLILLDEMLPSMLGSELLVRIKAHSEICQTPVIMLTSLKDDEHQANVLKFGADDYIHKPVRFNVLLARIASVLRRINVLNIDIPKDIKPETLGVKELNVLALVVKGYSNAKIAEELYISEFTVSNHLKSILTKLKADNRTHAAIIALKLNLI